MIVQILNSGSWRSLLRKQTVGRPGVCTKYDHKKSSAICPTARSKLDMPNGLLTAASHHASLYLDAEARELWQGCARVVAGPVWDVVPIVPAFVSY